MPTVERFQDLIAWQRARTLNKLVYGVTRRPAVYRDRDFVSQIRRASVSVMSNIAEGFERGGRSEFHQFLSISKASAAEVYSLLYVALDATYISEEEFTELQRHVEEVARVVGGLRSAVARQRDLQQTRSRTPSKSSPDSST